MVVALRFSRRRVVLCAAVVLVCLAAGARDSGAGTPSGTDVQGITISTHTDGRDWAADMSPTMKEIKELGANWVTIHPYASIARDGGVRFRPIDPEHPPAHIVRPIEQAHALGLKILIKPHLAYWGSPFKWRGEIRFDSEAAWGRFWRDYERWIVAVAAVTREADGFVVGTELDSTLEHETAWRRVIDRARAQTPALLTYAANWSDFERVGFWDALDVIGIQAYFPLTDREDADEGAIRQGWDRLMLRLRGFSERHERPILFTELGYNQARTAAVRPWEAKTDGEETRALQQTCMRTALRAVGDEPSVIGAFLWKWFPQPWSVGRNFQLATPEMKAVIREVWSD